MIQSARRRENYEPKEIYPKKKLGTFFSKKLGMFMINICQYLPRRGSTHDMWSLGGCWLIIRGRSSSPLYPKTPISVNTIVDVLHSGKSAK